METEVSIDPPRVGRLRWVGPDVCARLTAVSGRADEPRGALGPANHESVGTAVYAAHMTSDASREVRS